MTSRVNEMCQMVNDSVVLSDLTELVEDINHNRHTRKETLLNVIRYFSTRLAQ